MEKEQNKEENINNSNEENEDLSFESISSIRKSIPSLDSSQNNQKIINKSDINIVKNHKLILNDSSSIDSSNKIKTVIENENIEIPKLLNNTIKNTYVPLLNLNINLSLANKRFFENKSLLFLKLHYNLLSTYMTKGFDKNKINFQNELIELQKFKADSEQIWVASLDVTKNYLATGGKSGILKIWKINTMQDDHNKYINSFLFKNEDTETILDEEEKKSFLNIIDESVYKIYYSHDSDITDISWSKKYPNILVTVSIDSKAVLYDINQNSPIDIFTHEKGFKFRMFLSRENFIFK